MQTSYGAPVPSAQKTNGMAVTALVSGILGFTMCPGIGSVVALVTGYIARGQIERSGGTEGGHGMAIAGIVMGWIGVALVVLTILAFLFGMFALLNIGADAQIHEVIQDAKTLAPEPFRTP